MESNGGGWRGDGTVEGIAGMEEEGECIFGFGELLDDGVGEERRGPGGGFARLR
jgi:hypothetical protein